VCVPAFYKGIEIGRQRVDVIVDGTLIVEAKSTHELDPMARRQLGSDLHATKLPVGLLRHFGPEPRFRRMLGTVGA
jgi:GxxExxY protein